MKRVHAFTLVEVLVSLFLVALLGTFAVMALGGSSQDLRGLDELSAQRMDVLWFCTRARTDLDRAGIVTVSSDGALVMDVAGVPVRYDVKGDTVVRSSPDGREAFLVRPVGSSVEEVPFTHGLVREWRVLQGPADTAVPLIFHKDHDARTIARYITDHGDTP